MTTPANERPFILVVDDEPDELLNTVGAGLADRVDFDVLHPRDVEVANLEKADLVLVDYVLDHWPERDSHCIALQPRTGMSLAAILREHVDRSKKVRLTAFALHTGYLNDIRLRVPVRSAQHVLARLSNLEWVFPKQESLYDQMIVLAGAVRRLPQEWPGEQDKSASELKSILGMEEEAPWFDRCWRDVYECQPPIHELQGGGHCVLLIRWLLHQVMPYPTFLWEEHWVAARLRVPVDEFRSVIAAENPLSDDLKSMRYSGLLAGFLKDRWWRGALEDYVWDLAGGGAGDARSLRSALQERAEKELGTIEPNPPVVCLDPDLHPTDHFASPANAVRLRPDHWPCFADAPWMEIQTVQGDPVIVAMVDPLDQDRIGGEDEE